MPNRKRIADRLRRWAERVDPPAASDPPARKSPHPVAVAGPVTLAPTPESVGSPHTGAGNAHLGHGMLPGRWGGPYV